MSWRLVYTKQAQKDAKKLVAAGLKRKAEELLKIISENPFQTPPPYEKLVATFQGLTQEESIFSTAWSIRFMKMKR